MGVLDDFNATMRNVAQMQAGRGQIAATTNRGTREALAMLQAQFNQMAQAGRETREAGLGRKHEAGLLDKRLKEEGYQKSVAQRSAERIAGLAQRGAGERLDISEGGATARHKETLTNRITAAQIAAGESPNMTYGEKYEWAENRVLDNWGEKMLDWEWRKENADIVADYFRRQFTALNPAAKEEEIDGATETFKMGLYNPHSDDTTKITGDPIVKEIGETVIESTDDRDKLLDLIERYKNTLEAWTPGSSGARAAQSDPLLMGLGSGMGQLFSGMVAGKEINPAGTKLNSLWDEARTTDSFTRLREILARLKEMAATEGRDAARMQYQQARKSTAD